MAKDPTYGYQYEKFLVAAHALCGSGTLQERVHAAWTSFMMLDADDFDEVHRSLFKEIDESLTKEIDDPNEEGYVAVNIRKMNEHEIEEISRQIFNLFVEIHCRYLGIES